VIVRWAVVVVVVITLAHVLVLYLILNNCNHLV
jgi:hypothetical protein